MIWTALIGQAFLEAFDVLKDAQYLRVAESVGRWIVNLPIEHTSSGSCLSYNAYKQESIHNSNAMGAAFLLLETMSVVRFALLFGTTWYVNALVFLGILIAVWLAIEIERRRPERPTGKLFPWLFLGLALAIVVPGSLLLELSPVPRFLIAAALAFFPVFVANLVFARRFRTSTDPTSEFGTNLLGAMAGGALEYFSMVTGYRALLVVAGALYGFAWWIGKRRG